MTDVTVLTIDQLPSASFVSSTNLIPILQGGVTKSATLQILSNSANMLPLGSYVASSDLISVVQGDNVARRVTAQALGSAAIRAFNTFSQPLTGSAPRPTSQKVQEIVSVADFTGADSSGATDSRAAFQAAVAALQSRTGGGVVYAPQGSYLIGSVASSDAKDNGIFVPFTSTLSLANRVRIVGEGLSTVLKAGANNMYVVRWSDSMGGMSNLAIDSNGHTSVSGLGVLGPNRAGTVGQSDQQNFNLFENLWILNCAEGLELQASSQGGCYYNTFRHLEMYTNTRHINIRDCTIVGAGVPTPNRNRFFGVLCEGGNCGVYIDGADTNRFVGCDFEGIAVGVSPLATPTAVFIQVGSVSGRSAVDTNIIGCTWEANTADLNCSVAKTYIIGGNCGASGATVTIPNGINLMIGDVSPSRMSELQFGSATSDGLLLQPRQSNFSNACAEISTSSNQAAAYPFNADGNLLIKGRETSSSQISFFVGASPTNVMQMLGSGVVKSKHTIPLWVNFAGSSGNVFGSQGVSSVTRNGVGSYTINFTFQQPDANYVVMGANSDWVQNSDQLNVGSFRVNTFNSTTAAGVDPSKVYVGIVGNF